MKVSVVFGYRNRDSLRVDRCLASLSMQSFKDFDVIFVDYGSDIEYSESVKCVIKCYSFVKYYYLNVKGYPWNRSHALNTGVKISNSDYILFGDIDLIYSPDSIANLLRYVSVDQAVYSSIYYLKKGFNKWNDLFLLPLSLFKSSESHPIGAVFLVSRSVVERIRGYDEFYCIWGVEDRDFFHRLDALGMKIIPVDKTSAPIFHQWHPIVSNQKKGFFPDRWWDEMNIHFQLNSKVLERNDSNWGKLILNRPIEHATPVLYDISDKYIKSYQKAALICDIIKRLSEISSAECLEIRVHKNRVSCFFSVIIKLINAIVRKCRLPIGVDYISNVEREKYSYLADDILYLVWQLIKVKRAVLDYNMREDKDCIIIQLMKI